MFEGVKILLELFFVTTIFSIPLGIAVAFVRLSNNKIASSVSSFYIWIMRGSPLLLQMMFFYYVLPIISPKLVFDQLTVAFIAFVINYAAYYAEIFRGGLLSIDKGQFEAAKVLGFDKVTMYRRIILPQLTKRVLPPVSNELITLVKDTSLVYILGLNDLLRVATAASNREASLMPFAYAAVIYLVMTAILTKLMAILEKRYSYYR
ncbi:amino acid ABC transporter permease [Peptostreptococcus sp.]|jgi:amino ABC transporter, permease protein, 3-TM region, his/glu/gln/arg/opine family|uniref:amino acid ABC transporter permease n=1 Tax=Peptostreptococcus sp. TaxID=1262 RepID=UPI001CB34AE1|nr:amino acid ABC transporter permease [Peptostreptococcus sp.]MBF1044259.1 amino acid ABC transporter permease [Peptostreptococcus sp.]MBF1048253.1 amino acid ABC transporter permease [Peptostreptococcus sp.]MBF1049606.1 amino acid ABC transporter permease [Peptostreptococcus sp.]MBF1057774.1 amino acid ABC transporter permease [Peptostreptococcus sp.]MBF1058512.1 amino acid ABC transporter permease [Peptostreptococcus sp.]